jgi:hypothetical protein
MLYVIYHCCDLSETSFSLGWEVVRKKEPKYIRKVRNVISSCNKCGNISKSSIAQNL